MTNNKKSTRYYSRKQEMKAAHAVHAKMQANSGATPFYKGDLITNKFLIECKTKTTDSKSMSIKEDWIIKSKEEAFAMGKLYSAICFDFGPSSDNRYYVIDESLFNVLKNYLEES